MLNYMMNNCCHLIKKDKTIPIIGSPQSAGMVSLENVLYSNCLCATKPICSAVL